MKTGHGGARPGAGKPKGVKWPSTLAKEKARELARKIITRQLEPMIRAHVAHAVGIGHLYTRDKNGKFNKIESQAEVDRLLAEGGEGKDFWIFTKDPSTESLKELLNRALDKPKEQELDVKLSGELTVVEARLIAARERLAKRE